MGNHYKSGGNFFKKLSHKRERIWVRWTDMDEPWAYYTEWRQSEGEKQIPYINAYIWDLEKNSMDETICRAERETQTYRKDLWTQSGKERVWWTESVALKNTHYQCRERTCGPNRGRRRWDKLREWHWKIYITMCKTGNL